MKALSKLLVNQDVNAIFCKLLTKNDDSGKHGIVVPTDAYRILPFFKSKQSGKYIELPCKFTSWSKDIEQSKLIKLRYKYYHQPSHSGSERRLTNFRSKALNNSKPNDLFILARTSKGYFSHFIPADNKYYQELIVELALQSLAPGSFIIDAQWNPQDSFVIHPELQNLLDEFDKLKLDYHPTVNPAPEGVGATFETLLGINRNNSQNPDYKGIEIKCYKSKDGLEPYDQDLFLKEPIWVDDASGAKMQNRQIIEKYGYPDELGRQGLKVRLWTRPNAQGLYLIVDRLTNAINIMHADNRIGYWLFEIIKKRLMEKHKYVVFIGAKSRNRNGLEEFRYEFLIFCSAPSPDNFAHLITKNCIKVELRMHLEENNKLRNHGTQFRIQDSRLSDLYAVRQKLR